MALHQGAHDLLRALSAADVRQDVLTMRLLSIAHPACERKTSHKNDHSQPERIRPMTTNKTQKVTQEPARRLQWPLSRSLRNKTTQVCRFQVCGCRIHLSSQRLTWTSGGQHRQIPLFGSTVAGRFSVSLHKLLAGFQEGQVAAAAGVKNRPHAQRLEKAGQLAERLHVHRLSGHCQNKDNRYRTACTTSLNEAPCPRGCSDNRDCLSGLDL